MKTQAEAGRNEVRRRTLTLQVGRYLRAWENTLDFQAMRQADRECLAVTSILKQVLQASAAGEDVKDAWIETVADMIETLEGKVESGEFRRGKVAESEYRR